MKTSVNLSILLTIGFLFFNESINAQADSPSSQVPQETFDLKAKVDRRVELFTIVARLAGLEEYSTNTLKKYSDDIDRHFGKYGQHPAIRFARELRDKQGLGYDAVMTMAVHLSPPPELEPRVPFELAFTDGGLDDRWGSIEDAEKFLGLLRKFYKDAGCEKFFASQKDFYSSVEARFQPVLDQVDLDWYPKFYGEMPGGTFYVYILLDSRGNYGPEVVFSEEKKDIYALITSVQVDDEGLPVYGERQLATLIHEFSHPFINPLFFANKKKFETAGEKIFASAQKVREIGYGNWESPVIESLVRAAVIRYMIEHEEDVEVAYKRMILDRNLGFIWIEELVNLLGAYENSRESFPTFSSLFPLTIGYFDDLSKRIEREAKEFEQRSPRVIDITPFPNNSQNVNPEISEITLTFDKPLDKEAASSIEATKSTEESSQMVKQIALNESGTVLTLKVAFEPNTKYEYELPGSKYRTTDGYPLQNYVLKFKTE